MTLPFRLGRYLSFLYFKNFLIFLFGILGIIYLFDIVELLRRASKIDDIELPTILLMGVFKLPEVGQITLLFVVLFSAMMTFWQLTTRHELVILRSAGLSVWQFLFPVIVTVFMLGLFNLGVVNPIGALLMGKYESLETKYLDKKSSLVSLTEQGLWLRQPHDNGMVILYANKVEMPDWRLKKIIALFFDNDHDFIRRIDAPEAILKIGEWQFDNAIINQSGFRPQKAEFLSLATDLTAQDLENSFASPETIPIWKLKSYIHILEQAGFDPARLKIHFQVLLAQPFLFMAMILLAATVALRPPRQRGGVFLVLAGIFMGFLVFFSSSFLQALGASQQVPLFIAGWFPALITFILGLSALIVLEDG